VASTGSSRTAGQCGCACVHGGQLVSEWVSGDVADTAHSLCSACIARAAKHRQ
jgi:hypothetical protein